MKSTELRIGNYFGYWHKTFKVLSIQESCVLANSNRGRVDFAIENLEPIPLTEKWLLKFGFEKIGVNYIIKKFNVYTKRTTGEFVFRDTIETFKIKHVHQLQNLYFALTNEELCLKD